MKRKSVYVSERLETCRLLALVMYAYASDTNRNGVIGANDTA